MAIKYLYIDDESTDRLQPLVDAICDVSNELKIDLKHPKDFEDNLDSLRDELSDYEGLILDWRLDEIASSSGRAKFRAGTLAQELRTRATENQIKKLPITLWSTNEQLQGSYSGDDTSHDLFDETYLKENVVSNPKLVHDQLLSLSKGYASLQQETANTLQTALGLESEQFNQLDINLTNPLSQYDVPVHKTARFVLSECIKRPGVLIDENLLAAKLGVDIENSSDWEILRDNHLQNVQYQGVFHEAWLRWWLPDVQHWWSQIGDVKPASRYSASKRVEILQEAFSLSNLQVAEPIMPHYSVRYDTICQHYQRPLDKLDGVIIHEQEPKSWQDYRYLSLKAVLSREYKDAKQWKPHPIEFRRLEELRGSSQ